MQAFESPSAPGDDSRYGLYNFHDPQDLERLSAALSGADQSFEGVIEISGPAGYGREYLLRAACHALERSGQPLQWVKLGQDYEPDVTRPEDYLMRLAREQQAVRRQRLDGLLAVLQPIVKSRLIDETLGLWLSLLLQLRDPLEQLLKRFQAHGGPDFQRPNDDRLPQLLRALSDDAPLLLVLDEATALPLAQALLRALRWVPGLRLAFLRREPAAEMTYPGRRPLRLNVAPLTRQDVARCLARRFPGLPAPLADALWRAGGRHPGLLAQRLAQLQDAGLVRQRDHTSWQAPAPDDPRLGAALAEGLSPPIDQLLARATQDSPERGERLRRFLVLCALCGPLVPIETLAAYMAAAPKEAEWLYDQLDDSLPELAAAPVFLDLGVHHEGFENLELRAYANPLLPAALLSLWPEARIREEAERLYRHLAQYLPPTTRPRATLHQWVRQHFDAPPPTDQLAWWVGLAGNEALQEELGRQVREGGVEPDVLMKISIAQRDYWPAARCLAVLEAYAAQKGGVSVWKMAEWLNTKGSFMVLESKLETARELFEQALAIVSANPSPYPSDLAACHNNLGGLLQQLGDIKSAALHLNQAMTIWSSNQQIDFVQLAYGHNNLGLLFRNL